MSWMVACGTMADLEPSCPLDPDHPSLLIYDGQCRLCVTTTQGLERAGLGVVGSGLQMIPYESEAAARLLGDRYRPGPPAMALLVHPSGQVLQGIEAFLPLAPRIPGGRIIRWMLRRAFVRALAERVYRWVATNRYRMFGAVQSCGSCLIPPLSGGNLPTVGNVRGPAERGRMSST